MDPLVRRYLKTAIGFLVIGLVLGLVRYSIQHTTGETPELGESIDFFMEDLPPQRIKNIRPKRKRKKKPAKTSSADRPAE